MDMGTGDGQGGLACYGSWDRKESDTTERLDWTEPGDAVVKNIPAKQEIQVQPTGQ